ncbi:hypothetical protein [uncultured Polaribacter sp.]|uniref:hypothetical protein n=1 Tax=uncultured Polaribacter sp. TaxID=174711 RepID=UPI00261F24DC|nr:hypothetical protein [uncultured Polaribacter sp.]
MSENLTVKFKDSLFFYQLIFSDGVVLKKAKTHLGKIDLSIDDKNKHVIETYRRPNDRWSYYVLWSNGEVEKFTQNKCKCSLPKEQECLSPVDYEMYVLLFNNWVKKGKIKYLEENRDSLADVVKQFEKENSWLDDLVFNKFKCIECSDELILSINTYRGGGKGFYRVEKRTGN